MKALYVKYIQMETRVGANIYDCWREAILLCLTEDRDVRFSHNGETFLLHPSSVITAVGAGEGLALSKEHAANLAGMEQP